MAEDPRWRALDGVEPPDQWDDIAGRVHAADGALPPALGGGGGRRRVWLAAAAVVLLAGLVSGALALATDDDGQTVDAGSADDDAAIGTRVEGRACEFGLTGAPLEFTRPVDAPTDQIFVELPDQTARISVPGEVVIDLVGEQTEEIDFGRGPATLWLREGAAVQVRWFPGDRDPCGSFTVEVTGPDRDANRHVAIDLAQRMVLPSDLETGASGDPSSDGELLAALEGGWVLDAVVDDRGERFAVDDQVSTLLVESGEVVLHVPPHGCTTLRGHAEVTEGRFALRDRSSAPNACILPLLAWDDVPMRVLDGDPLLRIDGDRLTLQAGAIALEYVRAGADGDHDSALEAALDGTTWRIDRVVDGGSPISGQTPKMPGPLTFVRGHVSLAEADGCNTASGPYRVEGRRLIVAELASTAMGCADPAASALPLAVLGERPSITLDRDELTLVSTGNRAVVYVRVP